jgi:hypothetical protein
MLAPQEAREFSKTAEYASELDTLVTSVRRKLDSDGRGDKLFDMYRAKENEDSGKYRLILVGALMMRAGAMIREADMQYLRQLVPQINCNEGYVLPIFDEGFRGPGKRQFLAALDHYQPGTPRNFSEPSCYAAAALPATSARQRCSSVRAVAMLATATRLALFFVSLSEF